MADLASKRAERDEFTARRVPKLPPAKSPSASARVALAFTALILFASACRTESDSILSGLMPVAPAAFLDAFWTKDQQARAWFEAGEPLRAAGLFRDPTWKGIAYEATGNHEQAALAFDRVASAEGAFRAGNARARNQELAAATKAYERALAMRPDFPEARFNLDWLKGLIRLSEEQYEDFGGTGGHLEADAFVFDHRAANAVSEMTVDEARSQGLSPEAIREMWMRRIQTTPADFLRLKFAYQAQAAEPQGEASP